jgi:hypothetical protein
MCRACHPRSSGRGAGYPSGPAPVLVPLALATGVDWRVLLLLLLTARQSTAAAVLPAVDWQQQQQQVAAAAAAATAKSGAVPAVRLFTDPRVVNLTATDESWSVRLGPITKDANNPLLIEDQLWDVRWDNTYITSRYDHESNTFRLWYNGFVSCGGYKPGPKPPGPGDQCGHPTWHTTFGARGLIPWPNSTGRPWSALMYAESHDGVHFRKNMSVGIQYPWNGSHATPTSPTNILMMGEAASGTGVLYDVHERNASRRYKALGSLWNYLHCGRRPAHAVHGTRWPPCQCLGAAFSSDGVHWSGPTSDESEQSGGAGDVPGLNIVGQDDGALDLAIWDEHLGSYWGYVRQRVLTAV